jgi:hypothetical protein
MRITTILNPVPNNVLNQTEKTLYDDNIYLPTVSNYTNDNEYIMLKKRIKIQERTPILSAAYSEASLNSNIYPGLDNLKYFLKIENLNNIYNKSVENRLKMNDNINIYSNLKRYNYSTVKLLKSNQDMLRHMMIHKNIQNNIVSYLNTNISNISNISNKWTIMFVLKKHYYNK